MVGNNISKGYKLFSIFNYIIMILVILVTLWPFYYTIVASFSSESAVINGKVSFLPVDLNLNAYKMALDHPRFWCGYKNTILYTILGTAFGLVMNILCAYPLSKKRLAARGLITKFITFSMFFSGGLIPNFILILNLGMRDTIWAVTIPTTVHVWHIIIMRTFFNGIPESLEEAATIDGMGTLGVLTKIILPLSKPILATIGLFIAVFQWNNWFASFLYIKSADKYPVTIFLRNLLEGARLASETGEDVFRLGDTEIPVETLKSATILLLAFPILCVYPFIQKYFVKGMMIGSLKG